MGPAGQPVGLFFVGEFLGRVTHKPRVAARFEDIDDLFLCRFDRACAFMLFLTFVGIARHRYSREDAMPMRLACSLACLRHERSETLVDKVCSGVLVIGFV